MDVRPVHRLSCGPALPNTPQRPCSAAGEDHQHSWAGLGCESLRARSDWLEVAGVEVDVVTSGDGAADKAGGPLDRWR